MSNPIGINNRIRISFRIEKLEKQRYCQVYEILFPNQSNLLKTKFKDNGKTRSKFKPMYGNPINMNNGNKISKTHLNICKITTMKQFEVKVQLQGGTLTLPVKIFAVFVQLVLCRLWVVKKIKYRRREEKN